MTTSRDTILNKLRAARKGEIAAPPRPKDYLPVTVIDDTSTEGLINRFVEEITFLKGEAFVVEGDSAACAKILDLIGAQQTTHILAWDFTHIPVAGLASALKGVGIEVTHPELNDEFEFETKAHIGGAGVGIVGVDYAAASTGTLIMTSGKGRSRAATILPPALIAVVTVDQLIPRIEDFVAAQRANGLDSMWNKANIFFVTGPSKTGDIEMNLILGVHGPGIVKVIIKK